MLVFIDDSGDPGFKLNKGSSKVFVISCVIFDDELEAEKTAVAIKEFRRKMKFPDTMEFKFNKSSRKIRKGFLTEISKYKFRIRAIVMQKEKIYSWELKKSKESFYSYAIKMVLKYDNKTLKNAKIKLDGHGERIFRRKLTTYLRRELNVRQKKVVSQLRFVNSKTNVLIQMADMVAGSIYRKYTSNKKDADIYYSILKKHRKIQDCWVFGKQKTTHFLSQ